MSGALTAPTIEPAAPPARPIRAAMFTPSAFGGHARYTRELLTALAASGPARGVRPELVTSEDLADEYRVDAYPIHAVLPRLAPRSELPSKAAWVASRLTHYPRRERALLRWADAGARPDLIHAQEFTPWIAPALYRAFRKRGIAVVETVHNIHDHKYYNAAHRRLTVALTRAARRRCDALIVHTDGLRDELSANLGPGHPPIFVAPHGVWSVEATDPTPADPSAPLLFFGVVRENKGLHVLIEALGRLPGLRLIAAGHFPTPGYRDEVAALIERHAPGRVELIDRFVTEAEASSLFESSGLVVLPYT
ncbi:MAG: glycosyltransferase family 4 protein, partial [Thermoleophilia bacterium]|nr:glycosyltransferase family 4 protein [Thermoleophilia bacterium]